MTPDASPEEKTTVAVLRRPPIRQSTIVRSDVQHTFDVFVRTMGVWWPRQFSAGQDRVRNITVEPRPEGRVYETWDDGTSADWGKLLAFEPPKRFLMTWTGTPAETEVELTFSPLGPSLTRVTLEHRGWEALTEEQLTQDCALPGGYRSGAFAIGWAYILSRLSAAAESEDAQTDSW